jgi:hypothetical protein
MKKKFVKLSPGNNKVSDVIVIEGTDAQDCQNKFNASMHPNVAAMFNMYDESVSVEVGQLHQGADNFIDEPPYTPTQEDINYDAKCEINSLTNNINCDIIAYLAGMSDCPQSIKDADVAIKIEQAKIQ